MNRETIGIVLKENESLKLKVQRIEQSVERIQSRYYDAENELNTFKKKYSFLSEQFREIVRQCFPRDFIENSMREYSEKELYEFLVTKIRSLESDTFNGAQEKNKLEKQIDNLHEELERWKNAGSIAPTQSGPVDPNENSVDENREIPIAMEVPKEISKNENPVLGLMEILDEKEWTIIKILGEGQSMFTDISTESGLNNSSSRSILDGLVEKGVANFNKVEKGGRGRPAHHYYLTPLGVKIFESKFESKPQKTIMEKMSTHGSPAHGGLMVEVGSFLEQHGLEVTYDGPETTYRLKDGRDIIFDIKAYDKETKEIIFIETERAKCGPEHLREKFDKCLLFVKLNLTKTIHIISPDKESSHQIQQQLFKWVRKNLSMLDKNQLDRAVIIFKTATLEEFKAGKFQTFHYGTK